MNDDKTQRTYDKAKIEDLHIIDISFDENDDMAFILLFNYKGSEP